MQPLPSPPPIRIVVASDRSDQSRATGGFLNVRRLQLIAGYPDGSESAPFSYDVATREALDAVVIAAHFVVRGVRHVYLRSATRPPCALRPIPPAHDGALWELPAGLVEPEEDPADTAARELSEELGFVARASDMTALGGWTFAAPGMIGERHLFYAVQVDPGARKPPSGDGSALEHAAGVVALPTVDAIEYCRRGAIRDAKTELGLRRLLETMP